MNIHEEANGQVEADNGTVLPLPPMPTGLTGLAGLNAFKVWQASCARINAHNAQVQFGAEIAAEEAAIKAKRESEKEERDAATKRYKETGAQSQNIVALVGAKILEFGGETFANDLLYTGPTKDEPSGHPKGSRAMGTVEGGILKFGASKFVVVLKRYETPADKLEGEADADGEAEE